MELILCEKPKVGRDTARLLGIKEQHQEYIVCKDGKVGSWAIGCLFLRSFTPLQGSNGPTTLPGANATTVGQSDAYSSFSSARDSLITEK
jgi:hypothetical protein